MILLWGLAAAVAATGTAEGTTEPEALAPATVVRLEGLVRTWGHVKHFHPWLATRSDIDWDGALVTAAPAVVGAEDDAAYAEAIAAMLAVLDDPATRIERAGPVGTHVAREASHRVTQDGVSVLRVGDPFALAGADARAAVDGAAASLETATAFVLDLRAPAPLEAYGAFQVRVTVGPLERQITDRTLETPAERRRVYYGFPSTQPFASGQYRSALLTSGAGVIRPAQTGRTVPTVVILNRHAALLDGTVAAHASGQSRIVFEGPADAVPDGGADTLALAGGVQVRVRTSEWIHADGRDASLRPDLFVAEAGPGEPDRALQAALAAARAPAPSAVERRHLPATAPPVRDRSYRDMALPDLGHRVLALARFWSTIAHFYPYLHLLDTPWDHVLTELLPRFLGAASARDYALAVATLATRIQDSHAYVSGPAFDAEVVPTGYPPIRVRWIEGTPVVTALRHPELARQVDVGDVVVEVDGEEARARLLRFAARLSASTEASRLDKAALQFLNGAIGTRARLVLEGPRGTRTVRLKRRAEDYTTLYHRERTGDVVQHLDGDVGYVDLDRLELSEVDAVFERLAGTRAIVFDMRGYPRGTAWALGPRLAEAPRTVALLSTPMPGHASPAPAAESFRQEVLPAAYRPRYTGRTLLLIDERTQSQAEHTGLTLRAANGTLFVGSPSAGANGEVTSVTLPGGLTVGFTGQSVRHPDGSELQRRGLVPDVEIRPTLRGIRAGRDEVLERALAIARGG